MMILVTGDVPWRYDADGLIWRFDMVRPLPMAIVGAEQARRWPRKPIRYSTAELARIGHTLDWRVDGRQRVKVVQLWRGKEIRWQYDHFMESV